MLCNGGRSYRVNEYKKDTSFRSFIRCMLIILVVFVAIYCLMLTIRRTNDLSVKTETVNQPSHVLANEGQHDHIQAVDTKASSPKRSTENSTIQIHYTELTTQQERHSETGNPVKSNEREKHPTSTFRTETDETTTAKSEIMTNINEKTTEENFNETPAGNKAEINQTTTEEGISSEAPDGHKVDINQTTERGISSEISAGNKDDILVNQTTTEEGSSSEAPAGNKVYINQTTTEQGISSEVPARNNDDILVNKITIEKGISSEAPAVNKVDINQTTTEEGISNEAPSRTNADINQTITEEGISNESPTGNKDDILVNQRTTEKGINSEAPTGNKADINQTTTEQGISSEISTGNKDDLLINQRTTEEVISTEAPAGNKFDINQMTTEEGISNEAPSRTNADINQTTTEEAISNESPAENKVDINQATTEGISSVGTARNKTDVNQTTTEEGIISEAPAGTKVNINQTTIEQDISSEAPAGNKADIKQKTTEKYISSEAPAVNKADINQTSTEQYTSSEARAVNKTDINLTNTEKYISSEAPELNKADINQATTKEAISSEVPVGNKADINQTTTKERISSEVPAGNKADINQTTTKEGTSSESPTQNMIKVSSENSVEIKKPKTCQNAECKGSASKILQLMDHSVDPCEDLFQYSCGGAGENSEIDPRIDVLLEASFNAKNSADEQLKSFYNFFHTCIQYEEDSGYSKRLEQVLDSEEIRANNLTELLVFLMLRQTTPLFELRFGLIDNSEGYGLQVLPPSDVYDTAILKDWSLQSHIKKHCLHLNGKLKYEEEINLQSVYNEYKDCKNHTFWRMMENFVSLNGTNQTKDYHRDYNFFFNKKHFSDIDIENAKGHHVYTKFNVSNLSSKYTRVDWKMFFNQLGFNVELSTPVHVYLEDEYFKDLMDNLGIGDKKEILNTLKLYYQLQLYENLNAQRQNNEEFCMKQAIQLMPEIAETLFAEHSKISHERAHFEIAFEELKDTYIYLILNISNLEEENKSLFKEKLEELKLEFFENDTANDMLDANSDYLSDLFILLEKKRRITEKPTFCRKRKSTNQFPIFIANTTSIVIPNSFIYRVTQNKNQPTYVSEIKIKFHLSIAIAQYLNEVAKHCQSDFYAQFMDGLWRNLESAGNKRVWKKQDLIYKLNESHSTVGTKELLLFNQMADNLAMQITFKSIFASNRTDESLPWIFDGHDLKKQFFILTAQELCKPQTIPALSRNLYETSNLPGMFRVDAMMRNSRDFSDAFNCKVGSRMSPSNEEKMEFDKFNTTNTNDYPYNYSYDYNPIINN